MRNNVRYYRLYKLYKGVSQRWLAQKVGCSHSTLGAIERGESAPNVYLAMRIARALGATVEELWRENHDR
jgi:putative transcriptional regulator